MPIVASQNVWIEVRLETHPLGLQSCAQDPGQSEQLILHMSACKVEHSVRTIMTPQSNMSKDNHIDGLSRLRNTFEGTSNIA